MVLTTMVFTRWVPSDGSYHHGFYAMVSIRWSSLLWFSDDGFSGHFSGQEIPCCDKSRIHSEKTAGHVNEDIEEGVGIPFHPDQDKCI